MRFFMWMIILLFITLGSGLYFWSDKKFETQAGTTTNALEATRNTLTTGLVGK